MSTEDVEAIAKSLTPDDYQKMREVQDGTWASQQAAKAEIETGLQGVPSADEEFGGLDNLPPEFLQAMEDIPDEATARLAARLAKPLIVLHQAENLRLRGKLQISMLALRYIAVFANEAGRCAKKALEQIRALDAENSGA